MLVRLFGSHRLAWLRSLRGDRSGGAVLGYHRCGHRLDHRHRGAGHLRCRFVGHSHPLGRFDGRRVVGRDGRDAVILIQLGFLVGVQMLVGIDPRGVLYPFCGVGHLDAPVADLGLLQRDEGLLQSEQTRLDRHPTRLPGLVIEVDLADTADPVPGDVDHIGIEQILVVAVRHALESFLGADKARSNSANAIASIVGTVPISATFSIMPAQDCGRVGGCWIAAGEGSPAVADGSAVVSAERGVAVRAGMASAAPGSAIDSEFT